VRREIADASFSAGSVREPSKSEVKGKAIRKIIRDRLAPLSLIFMDSKSLLPTTIRTGFVRALKGNAVVVEHVAVTVNLQ